jgi:hypothetical protein
MKSPYISPLNPQKLSLDIFSEFPYQHILPENAWVYTKTVQDLLGMGQKWVLQLLDGYWK